MQVILDANVVRTALATRFEPHELKHSRFGTLELLDVVMRRTHAPRIKSPREALEIPWVPAILDAHRSRAVQLCSTTLIEHEKLTQKHLRQDRTAEVFQVAGINVLSDPCFSREWRAAPNPVQAKIIPPAGLAKRYAEILRCLGENKRADASHVLTADLHGIHHIVSLDRPFVNAARNLARIGITTQVLPPKEFASIIGLKPWTDQRIRAEIERASFFLNQRIVPLAKRKRTGPFGLWASRYIGQGDFELLTHAQLKGAIKIVQRHVFWRALLRGVGPQVLWMLGNPERMRELDKRLGEPIPLE